MTTALAKTPTLATLAEQINHEHRQCTAAVNAGLQHALEAGRLLIEAKKLCPHGTWGQWLADNFEGSTRTAQVYIRVAKARPELEAKAQRSADLSLDKALKLLAAPQSREERPVLPTRPERPFWSVHESNKRMVKRLDIERCIGHLLNWAVENGVKKEHRLAQWLCPAEGWMNRERQFALGMALSSQDSLEPYDEGDEGRKSVKEVLTEVTAYYNGVTPQDCYGVLCMCDLAIGIVKSHRDAKPDDDPPRVAFCDKYTEDCVFGVCHDPEEIKAAKRALEKWVSGNGPAPFPWLEEIAGVAEGLAAK